MCVVVASGSTCFWCTAPLVERRWRRRALDYVESAIGEVQAKHTPVAVADLMLPRDHPKVMEFIRIASEQRCSVECV